MMTSMSSKDPTQRKPVGRIATEHRGDRVATANLIFGPIIRLPRPALTVDNTGNLYSRRLAQKLEPLATSAAWSPPDSWGVTTEQEASGEVQQQGRNQRDETHVSGSTWATTTASHTPYTDFDLKAIEAARNFAPNLQARQVLPDVDSVRSTADVELGSGKWDGTDYVDWIAEQRAKEEKSRRVRFDKIFRRHRKQLVATLVACFFLIIILIVLVGVLAPGRK